VLLKKRTVREGRYYRFKRRFLEYIFAFDTIPAAVACVYMAIFRGKSNPLKMPLSVVIVYMTIGFKAMSGAGFQESGNT
jgi:hypothetical protein